MFLIKRRVEFCIQNEEKKHFYSSWEYFVENVVNANVLELNVTKKKYLVLMQRTVVVVLGEYVFYSFFSSKRSTAQFLRKI